MCKVIACLLTVVASLVGGSINIKTLPPDLDRAEFSDLSSARSTVNPDWEGQHKAALDGDQGKVWISWTIEQQYITFQVKDLDQLLSDLF